MTSEQLKTDKPVEDNSPLILLGDRYKVLSVLGDGGFGQTFLVEDTHMPSNRRCVLKQLKPVHERPELRQMVEDRFQREAATLEMLGDAHDQIPRLYAYFSEGDQFYLVEEWVEGMTLTQKVAKEGALSEAQVQAIIANLLPAIAYVHSKKIVHRDIKPDNILLRQTDGKPVLIDFGAVKETMKTIIHSGEQGSTHSIVVGTPGYMPSEQLSGRPIYASDIYSLGMTAIFLLTGKIPQELGTDPQTGSLSWREHATNLSAGFGNFLDCATHMSPQSRFSTIQDMQHALNTLMMGQMSTAISNTQIPPSPTPNANNIPNSPSPHIPVPIPSATTTAPQSSQTVISSAPMGISGAGVSGAGVSGADMAASTPPPAATDIDSSMHTAMVAPLANGTPTSSGPSVVYAQPPASGAAWKGPAIIGGLVGLSIVVGALVVTERLPLAASNNAGDTEVIDTSNANATDATNNAGTTDNEIAPPTTPDPTTSPVAPQPTTPPAAAAPNANGTVIGQSGSKNIRAGAGTGFNVVDEVAVNARIQVIDRANDAEGYPWYRVVTPSGSRGWIAGQLIQIDGDARPVSPPQRPTPKPTPTPTPVDRTNATIVSQEAGSKNIRSGPGTSFGVAHEAYPGDRVIIQDSAQDAGGYTWYKVSFPESGAQGWIAAQLINRD